VFFSCLGLILPLVSCICTLHPQPGYLSQIETGCQQMEMLMIFMDAFILGFSEIHFTFDIGIAKFG
jgi:glutamate-1-semialdehyde aminotransferase